MNYRKEFISSNPVPFVLPQQRVPDGSVVLFEGHIVNHRAVAIAGIFCTGVGFLFAFLLFTRIVGVSDPLHAKLVVGAAVAVPVGLLCVASLWISGSAIQQLHCDGDSIEVVDASARSDTVVHRASVDEWRLIMHPVVVKQRPFGSWSGVALSLELRRDYWIVLACQEHEHDILEWLKKSPQWLGRIPIEQGEPWVRQGTIRNYLRVGRPQLRR